MATLIGPPAASGRTAFLYLAAGISALGGLLFGYDTGVISGATLFIRQDFHLSAFGVELLVSSVLCGATIGAACGGLLADRLGRRTSLILVAALFAAGAVGSGLAPTVGRLVACRVAVGVAIGVASFVTPLYISEVSPPDARGWLVSLNQLAITGGIVLSYLVDYALAGARAWGWMLGLAALPAAALGVGMLFMPETPRWLVAHGREDLARDVLRRCRGGPVGGELGAIRAALGGRPGSWAEVFRPAVRPALVVGIGLALFQQITGINTVIYYAPTIFQTAGFRSEAGAILATVGVGVVNVLLTVVSMGLVDRVGRRPLLLVSLGGMTVSLAALALCFAVAASSPALGWAAVVSLMLYVGFFAVGLGPVFWLLIAEIYPLAIRGRAMSVATLANWGSNLLVALTFLSLIGLLGEAGTFWLFAALGVAAWLFVFALVPETRGKSLEEIDLRASP